MIITDLQTYYKVVFYILAAVIGLCVGSFLNVVIYRVPINMSIAKPASHCPKCANPIKWYDNIPVVSYTFLLGKCRNCKTHIPFRYTAVELLNMFLWILSAFMFYRLGIVYALMSMAVSSILICVIFIDIENMIIPDRFQIMLLVLGILAIFFDKTNYGKSDILTHIIGGVGGFLILLLISFAVSKIVKKEALGGGDIKLVGVMGLFLGYQKLLLSILIASVTACVFIIFKKKKEQAEFPFGPFLSVGFLIAMYFGDIIIDAYLSLILL